jgi:hydroxymethylbilane synthase
MSSDRVIRLGTRKSALARVQAEMVACALRSSNPLREIVVETFLTSGDRKRSLPDVARDKRDWISEIEEALVQGGIGLAVHSGKDVPVEIAQGTELLPVLQRETPNDVFVPRDTEICWPNSSGSIIDNLEPGSRVGTASLRRGAQLLNWRSDLEIVELRGNVPTRLEKLSSDTALCGIVIAEAGLLRLDLREVVREALPRFSFLPAVNQGILCVQFAKDNQDLRACLEKLVIPDVHASWLAERAFIAGVGADCHSAVGVFAQVKAGELRIQAQVLSPDGRECLASERCGEIERASALGEELAKTLLNQGAAGILRFQK